MDWNMLGANNMDNQRETFHYTYSAKQQEEVRNIRKKYAAPEEDKMAQLRKLDSGATQKATAASLAVGIFGALLLGIGMCCAMVWMGAWFFPGIIIGLGGIALVCLAYPVYNRTLKREREKIAPEILKLTDELLQ